ncbi:MAG TPA: hypothetical protein VGO00_18595 [Kofleriaceae bacterium]|nr:hypothetical protein [Kofleriaceae bacterium]
MHRLWLLVLLTACDGDPIDRNIDGEVTIDNGVYGQVSVAADHVGNTAMVLDNLHVTAYTADSPPKVLMSTSSDEHGFFQIQTGPGTFPICTASATPSNGTSNPGPCTLVTVDSGNTRRDWVQNSKGGTWCNSACEANDNDDDPTND